MRSLMMRSLLLLQQNSAILLFSLPTVAQQTDHFPALARLQRRVAHPLHCHAILLRDRPRGAEQQRFRKGVELPGERGLEPLGKRVLPLRPVEAVGVRERGRMFRSILDRREAVGAKYLAPLIVPVAFLYSLNRRRAYKTSPMANSVSMSAKHTRTSALADRTSSIRGPYSSQV